MTLPIIILGTIFSLFSCLVLSYVSIATMFGPFIAPVLVLMGSLVFRLTHSSKSRGEINHELTLLQTIGSVGGMIAIGIGFTLPTLHFLAPQEFSALINTPLYFCTLIGALCLTAGGFGIWLGRLFFRSLLQESKLSFPVGVMIHETITSQAQQQQARMLLKGSMFSWITCMARDGFSVGSVTVPSVLTSLGLPKNVPIFPSIFGKELIISFMPMVWAIGFTAGMSIILPLIVGCFSKYLVVYPLNHHASLLPFSFFSPMSDEMFLTAFCSGIVIAEFAAGMSKYPTVILGWIRSIKHNGIRFYVNALYNFIWGIGHAGAAGPGEHPVEEAMNFYDKVEGFLVLSSSMLLLWYLGFSLITSVGIMIGTGMVTYNICYMAGKIGLVAFGRFVTFVMLPALFLFSLTNLQITLLCVFCSIAMATASNLLFSAKVGDLEHVSRKKIHRYTWLGLVITAAAIGFCIWLLCTHFTLGSAELFGQRGRSRALLIQSFSFDLRIVSLGFLYGYALRLFRLSPTMVFGGLLMPNNLTIGLSIGALMSAYSKDAKSEHPLWSGMLAGDSLWELVSIACKMIV